MKAEFEAVSEQEINSYFTFMAVTDIELYLTEAFILLSGK